MIAHFSLHLQSIFNTIDLSKLSFPDFCLLVNNILTQRTPIHTAFAFSSHKSTTQHTSQCSEEYISLTPHCAQHQNRFPNLKTHFEILEKIGSGSFSTIYKIRSSHNGKLYAAKQLPVWKDVSWPQLELPTSLLSVDGDTELSYSELLSHQFPSSLANTHSTEQDSTNGLDLHDKCHQKEDSHYVKDLSSYTEQEYIQLTINLVCLREIATMLYCHTLGLSDTSPSDQPLRSPSIISAEAMDPTSDGVTTSELNSSTAQCAETSLYNPIIPLLSICEDYDENNDEIQWCQPNSAPDRTIFLITPLYSHTLQDIIHLTATTHLTHPQQQTMNKPLIYTILHTIARGLRILHQHNIIHRDIKPYNILFNQTNGKFAICDFGSVRYFPSVLTSNSSTPISHYLCRHDIKLLHSLHPVISSLSGPHGTIGYKPLDLILLNPLATLPASSYPGHSIDVWALGCLAFALFGFSSRNGLLPSSTQQPMQVINSVLQITTRGLQIISAEQQQYQQSAEQQQYQQSLEQDVTLPVPATPSQPLPPTHQDTYELFNLLISSLFSPVSQQPQYLHPHSNSQSWSEFTAAQYLLSFITPYPISSPFALQSNTSSSPRSQLTSQPSECSSLSISSAIQSKQLISPTEIIPFHRTLENISSWDGFALVFDPFLTLTQDYHQHTNNTTNQNEFQPPSQPLPLLQALLPPLEYNFLLWTLALIPQQRPTMAHILNHQLFISPQSQSSIISWFANQLPSTLQTDDFSQTTALATTNPFVYNDDEMPYTNAYYYNSDDDNDGEGPSMHFHGW